MKKNILKVVVWSLLMAPAFTSCEMDQIPTTNTTPDKTWTNIADAESYRLGLYASLRGISGGIYTSLSDIQADDFIILSASGNYYGGSFAWTFNNKDTDDQTSIWASYYGFIASCNNVINNIGKIEPANDAEKVELDQILGEAHLMRAMAYHQLALYFAKDYEPETAANLPGLPLFKVVNVDAKPARASLQETYDFILEDLAAARGLMTDADPSRYLTNPAIKDYFLTTDALDLFEARVDLYAHKYQEAIDLCAGLEGKYQLETTVEGLQDMWLNDRGSEIIFQTYESKDERGNSNAGFFLGYDATYSNYYGISVYMPWYMLSGEWIETVDDNDIRWDASVLTGYSPNYTTSTFVGVTMLNKNPGNPALKKSTSDFYNTAKLFRAPEIYLIAAEAAYRLGDETTAKAYLNALHHDARQASTVRSSGENLFKAIKNEWRVEYIGEGMRFPSLKRWHEGFTRGSRQQQGMEIATLFKPVTIEPTDKRWVWEIPQQDLNDNKNLVTNW